MVRIAEVTYSGFPSDPRPRREIEALTDAGMKVDLFCMLKENQVKKESFDNLNVHRFNIKKSRKDKLSYALDYFKLIVFVSFLLSYNHLKKKYKLIHIHNMPDILVVSALIPKLLGAKVILDLHDPMPELFITKYNLNKSHLVIRFLILLEKISIKIADVVLTPNLAFKELFISRGCQKEKIHIIMNSPQEEIFERGNFSVTRKPDDPEENKFRLMFHGFIAERSGLDDAIRAIDKLKDDIPNIDFSIYGRGEYEHQIHSLISELKLENTVRFYGLVELEKIAEMITKIDLGLIPNRLNPFTNNNFPTRIFEYLSLKKPVIVPETEGIKDYFNNDTMFFFKPNDIDNLAEVILKVYKDKKKTDQIVANGFLVYQEHRWEIQKKRLIKIAQSLL